MLTKIEKYAINSVKELRIQKGLSQVELAVELDVSYGFIGKIESYKSKYNLNHLNKIAKILEVSPKDFLPNNSL